jgi:hypothetical protein
MQLIGDIKLLLRIYVKFDDIGKRKIYYIVQC